MKIAIHNFFMGAYKREGLKIQYLLLVNSNGVKQFLEVSKGEVAVDYFRSLLTSTNPVHVTDKKPATLLMS